MKYSIRNILAKTAAIRGLDTYHGTDARYLKSILARGLLAKKPPSLSAQQGVYLTSDIEKAARYAIDGIEKEHGIPCILEVYISGNKRVRKIRRDELDRDEDHLYDNNLDHYDESTKYLENQVKRLLYGDDYRYKSLPRQLDVYDDPANLKGYNLYQELTDYARSQNMDLQKFKVRMKHIIPPRINGDFEVTQSGVVEALDTHYTDMHQQVFPENIPPKAIKAVWLSGVSKDVPGERMEIKSKVLPQEKRRTESKFLRYVQSLSIEDLQDEESYAEVRDELRDHDEYGWFDHSDILNAKTTEDLEEAFLNLEQSINDGAFDDAYGDSLEFVRLDPRQALRIIDNISL